MLGLYILPRKTGDHISEKTTYRPCVNSSYRVREKSPYRDDMLPFWFTLFKSTEAVLETLPLVSQSP
jgi:hypothetical protein